MFIHHRIAAHMRMAVLCVFGSSLLMSHQSSCAPTSHVTYGDAYGDTYGACTDTSRTYVQSMSVHGSRAVNVRAWNKSNASVRMR